MTEVNLPRFGNQHMLYKIFFVTFASALLNCSLSARNTGMESGGRENFYKEIPHYQNQPKYWLFIHSNDCSYIAKIDDVPIYTDFNEGTLKSLSFPINPVLLQSGKHALNLTLLPKSDDNFNLSKTLSEKYSIKIKIVRNENKKDVIVFEREYKAEPNNSLPSKEYVVPFDVDVPNARR